MSEQNIQQKRVKVNVYPASLEVVTEMITTMAHSDNKWNRLDIAQQLIELLEVYEDDSSYIL